MAGAAHESSRLACFGELGLQSVAARHFAVDQNHGGRQLVGEERERVHHALRLVLVRRIEHLGAAYVQYIVCTGGSVNGTHRAAAHC